MPQIQGQLDRTQGLVSPIITMNPKNEVIKRAPTIYDHAEPLTWWLNPLTGLLYYNAGNTSGNAIWTLVESGGGAGVFTTLTSSGNTTLATGTGSTFTAGNTTGAVSIAPSATTATINIGGTGAATGTVTIAGGTGNQTVNIATNSTGTKTVTIGSSTGASALNLLAGSAGLEVTAAISTFSGDLEALSLAATGDAGGFAAQTTLTNVTVAAGATGAFVIHASSGSGTTASAGFLKMYVGTTSVFIPYWTQTT